MRFRVLPSAFALLLATGSAAAGDPSREDVARAADLFKEARAAMARDALDEACPKFAESQRLDPGSGTLLNLAVCHEKEGLTASAHAEFEESLAIARLSGRADREALAKEHLAALAPRLIRLIVEMPPNVAALRGLQVARDGVVMPPAIWRVPFVVDPGLHRIDVSAEGHAPWSTSFDVRADGVRKTIVVPALQPLDAPPPSPAETPASASPTSPAPSTPAPAPAPAPRPSPTRRFPGPRARLRRDRRRRRRSGLILRAPRIREAKRERRCVHATVHR